MDLRKKADEIREKTFRTIYEAGGGHYGGSLSAVEILTVLYFGVMNLRPAQPDEAQETSPQVAAMSGAPGVLGAARKVVSYFVPSKP